MNKSRFVIQSFLISVGISFCISLSYSQSSVQRKEVRTQYGIVSGRKSSSGEIYSFKGIPFASAPVGELRWKAPQPPASWQGVKITDDFAASPMQPTPEPFMVYTSE